MDTAYCGFYVGSTTTNNRSHCGFLGQLTEIVLLLPLTPIFSPLSKQPRRLLLTVFFNLFFYRSVFRQWHDEQETHLGQRAGSAGPPGMAVQEEGEQRLPGDQVEEVLVRAEEDVALLVHQPAGQITNPPTFERVCVAARVCVATGAVCTKSCLSLEIILKCKGFEIWIDSFSSGWF